MCAYMAKERVIGKVHCLSRSGFRALTDSTTREVQMFRDCASGKETKPTNQQLGKLLDPKCVHELPYLKSLRSCVWASFTAGESTPACL